MHLPSKLVLVRQDLTGKCHQDGMSTLLCGRLMEPVWLTMDSTGPLQPSFTRVTARSYSSGRWMASHHSTASMLLLCPVLQGPWGP